MRNYRDIGKTGVSFLTAFASGHTLDQDATGEGYLFNPGLYTNLLLPYDKIETPNEKVLIPTIIIDPNIRPNINNQPQKTETSYFTIGDYSANESVIANQNLANTKFNYEVYYENN